MAFNLLGLAKSTSSANSKAPTTRNYKTIDPDTFDDIAAVGYFDPVSHLFKVGDLLYVVATDRSGLLEIVGAPSSGDANIITDPLVNADQVLDGVLTFTGLWNLPTDTYDVPYRVEKVDKQITLELAPGALVFPFISTDKGGLLETVNAIPLEFRPTGSGFAYGLCGVTNTNEPNPAISTITGSWSVRADGTIAIYEGMSLNTPFSIGYSPFLVYGCNLVYLQ